MRFLHTGAVTFMTGIASGATAYAGRDDAAAVTWFILVISTIGLVLAAARADK